MRPLTWEQLEERAKDAGCSLRRQSDDEGGAVMLLGPDGQLVLDIIPSMEMELHETDEIIRAAAGAALTKLGEIVRGNDGAKYAGKAPHEAAGWQPK